MTLVVLNNKKWTKLHLRKGFLFAEDVILYLKDLRESTKHFLNLINKYLKITEYKINIKIVTLVYTNIVFFEK